MESIKKIKNNVKVSAVSDYLPEYSTLESDQHRFKYTISIENNSDTVVQIVGRRWTIQHSMGEMEEVRGLGVMGGQPFLEEGAKFSYESGVVLRGAQGTMVGVYVCIDEYARTFELPIPEFLLSASKVRH
jgi:ApaG protein